MARLATGGSLLRPLGPAARQDLVLLSVLAPLMVSNVAAPTSCHVGVSDASSKRGAMCSTAVPRDVAEHLWQTSDQRAWYSRLNQGPDDADGMDLRAPPPRGRSLVATTSWRFVVEARGCLATCRLHFLWGLSLTIAARLISAFLSHAAWSG